MVAAGVVTSVVIVAAINETGVIIILHIGYDILTNATKNGNHKIIFCNFIKS